MVTEIPYDWHNALIEEYNRFITEGPQQRGPGRAISQEKLNQWSQGIKVFIQKSADYQKGLLPSVTQIQNANLLLLCH